MSTRPTDVRVEAYLEAVRIAVAAVDPARAADITAEIAEHLDDADADAAERGEAFDVERAISELGDPAVIAAAVEPVDEAPDALPVAPSIETSAASPWVRVLSSRPVVVITLLATALGLFISPIVVVIALVLVWCSPRWGLGDKIVATLANPLFIVFALPMLSLGRLGAFGNWSLVFFAAPVVAGYLLLRLRRPDGQRRMRVPRADVGRPPRSGALGSFDGRFAGVVATVATPVALLVVTVPTLVAGDWRALPVTAGVAGAVLALALVVFIASTSWSIAERAIGAVALVLFGVVLAFVVIDVTRAVPLLTRCAGDVCRTLPAELHDPATLLDPVARWVLPIALFSAGWAAARFVAPGGVNAKASTPNARRAPLNAAARSLVGAVAAPAVILMSGGSLTGTAFAFAGLAVWLTVAVLVQRSPRWAPVDRWLTSLALPVITWFALAFFVADPEQLRELELAEAGGVYDIAAAHSPAIEVVPIVAVVAGLVQLAIAVRLLLAGRRRPLGSPAE
ncbi:hypothetical protein ACFVTX_10345 [Agromyces sp. NPDC058136]|uniref:HAAS signaling domain-containing protein n=1 Tax=Agromyces sp. NPDC058136 TaxID=3346354 RepID=UPI0036DF8605